MLHDWHCSHPGILANGVPQRVVSSYSPIDHTVHCCRCLPSGALSPPCPLCIPLSLPPVCLPAHASPFLLFRVACPWLPLLWLLLVLMSASHYPALPHNVVLTMLHRIARCHTMNNRRQARIQDMCDRLTMHAACCDRGCAEFF